MGNAERERAAAPDEVPLGEWPALRVRPDCNAPLTSQALLASSDEAKRLVQARALSRTCNESCPINASSYAAGYHSH